MADISFTDKTKMMEIIETSGRLKYLLLHTYQISLDNINSIRVDGDNYKIDVNTEAETLRFKSKGLENVIMKNPDMDVLQLTFDPALAQAIYNIVDEYAS